MVPSPCRADDDLASDSGGNLLVSARFGAIFALLNPQQAYVGQLQGRPGYGAQIAASPKDKSSPDRDRAQFEL